MAEERLYIKVILPEQGKERRVNGGGGDKPPFKPVTADVRSKLLNELASVEATLAQAPLSSRIVPMKVQLETKALAKSHRPTSLFDDRCPIIGGGRLGELYVEASHRGLDALKSRVSNGASKEMVRALSTVKRIAPVTAADRLIDGTPERLLEIAPKRGIGGHSLLKVRLFRYTSQDENSAKSEAFLSEVSHLNATARRLGTSTNHETYVVECQATEQVKRLADLVMVRSVGVLPTFRKLKELGTVKRPLPGGVVEEQPDAAAHPVVAVVDSGITREIPQLEPWVYGRETYVAPNEENRGHGSFVAGLLTWGHLLNPGLSEIEPLPCRLLDIHVMPNDDPGLGATGVLTEEELLEALEESLRKHGNEVKVWNLSLGGDKVCSLDTFSELAVELDDLQDRYNVTFVIAAGNYTDVPLLPNSRAESILAAARITSPADSVLGLTVGSIAHVDHISTGSSRGEASPFSRNGPGPNHIIKPELVHVGGNVALDGSSMLGLSSIGTTPCVVENIGTSFSTPLVSRQLAHVYHTITPTPSAVMAKAILTHNARDLRTGGRVPAGMDDLLGFGTPMNVRQALECTPWATTLVFEEALRPGFFLEWDDFPYPKSLMSGEEFLGEISMTLAYSPKRNSDYGSEYCETHVDATFGVYSRDKHGKEKYAGQVPLEHKRPNDLYESYQVAALRKWAPVRTYHRIIDPQHPVSGSRWRLRVSLLCRHDVEYTSLTAQNFALLLTISDPSRKAAVYDEMSQMLRTRYQTRNLALRSTVRVQAQSRS